MKGPAPTNPALRGSRRHHPKSRMGCLTCKWLIRLIYRLRRIKCDETRPFCVRCTSSGRKCEGYDPQQPEVTETKKSSLVRAISAFHGPPEETRAFQFFQERTVPLMDEIGNVEFWAEVVPRLFHAEEAIKHSVIAASSVHQVHGTLTAPAVTPTTPSLKHYHKALQLITKTDQDNIVLVLAACLVFACYEDMHGRSIGATLHTMHGRKILEEYKSRSPTQRSKASDELIEAYIEPIFTATLKQIVAFDQPTTSFAEQVAASIGPDDAPSPATPGERPKNCKTLEDVRGELDRMIQGPLYEVSDPQRQPNEVRDTRLLDAMRKHILMQIEKVLSTLITPDAITAGAVLRSSLLTTTVVSRLAPTDFETRFDEISIYEAVLYKSKATYEAYINLPLTEKIKVLRKQKTFGFIPPMFMVASRCRDPRVRRQALDLLYRIHIREGVWNSTIAAKIAQTVATVEERGAGRGVEKPEDIPLEKRVRALEVNIDRTTNRAILSYIRYPFLEKDEVFKETIWSWTDKEGQQWNDTVEFPLKRVLRLGGLQSLLNGQPLELLSKGSPTMEQRDG